MSDKRENTRNHTMFTLGQPVSQLLPLCTENQGRQEPHYKYHFHDLNQVCSQFSRLIDQNHEHSCFHQIVQTQICNRFKFAVRFNHTDVLTYPELCMQTQPWHSVICLVVQPARAAVAGTGWCVSRWMSGTLAHIGCCGRTRTTHHCPQAAALDTAEGS